MAKIYDFKTRSNKGAEVNFAQFEGKVLIIVNTASKCGFTPQYLRPVRRPGARLQ